MSDTVTYSPLRESDVAACAAVHRRAFSGFFLAQLGEPFLREFYRAFLGDDSAVTVVARDEGTVLGVAVGTTRPASFYSRLLRRRWWGFAWAGLLGAVRHPQAVPRLVRAVTYRGEAPASLPDAALFASMCVAPEAGGRGVGTAFMTRWATRAAQLGARTAYLTTDTDDNDAVHRLYVRHGWEPDAQYTTSQGRRMTRYVKDLTEFTDDRTTR